MMKRTAWLQETKKMRFDAPPPWGAPCGRPSDVPIRSRRIGEEAYNGWTARRLTQEDAARLLGVCARTTQSYIDRYEENGLDGLPDKRLTQVSHRRAPGPTRYDLSKLYGELPEDCQRRLEADFPSITEVLEHSREIFGKWRYFEEGVSEDEIRALVDTGRVRGLGKAARVIADECVVVGLNYSIDVETTYKVDWDEAGTAQSQEVHLRLEGWEALVPWDEVLASGGPGADNETPGICIVTRDGST